LAFFKWIFVLVLHKSGLRSSPELLALVLVDCAWRLFNLVSLGKAG
jgi:hypothetical protein